MDRSLADSLRRINDLGARVGAPPAAASLPASATVADLRRAVEDRSSSSPDRRSAFSSLSERLRGEVEFADVVLVLIDDPDDDLARDAIAGAPPFDGRVIAKLRGLLGDPRPARSEAAASALARKKDRAILPLMLSWARHGDAPHRRAGLAAVAFLLIPEEHLAVVESICEEGPRSDEDESVLIDALRVAESRVAFWRKATGQESAE